MINMYNCPMPKSTLKIAMNKIETNLIKNSYYNYIYSLKNTISHKVVKNSMVGSSGYILQFTDNYFVVCYLDNNKLNWIIDEAVPNPLHLYLIDSDIEFEDNTAFPSHEFKACYNEAVNDIKIFENTFDLYFENKFEIKSIIEYNTPTPSLKLSIVNSI